MSFITSIITSVIFLCSVFLNSIMEQCTRVLQGTFIDLKLFSKKWSTHMMHWFPTNIQVKLTPIPSMYGENQFLLGLVPGPGGGGVSKV